MQRYWPFKFCFICFQIFSYAHICMKVCPHLEIHRSITNIFIKLASFITPQISFLVINIHPTIVNSYLPSQCNNKMHLRKPLLDILTVYNSYSSFLLQRILQGIVFLHNILVHLCNYFPKRKNFWVKCLSQSLRGLHPSKQVSFTKVKSNFASKRSVWSFPSQHLLSPFNFCQTNTQHMLLLICIFKIHVRM